MLTQKVTLKTAENTLKKPLLKRKDAQSLV